MEHIGSILERILKDLDKSKEENSRHENTIFNRM